MRQPAQYPNAARKDEAGDGQMCGKAILRDIRAVNEAGGHHPPADEALKAAKRQKADQRQAQALFDATGEPEEGERQSEDDADGAGKQSMRPFPPENRLELVERHALVDFLILGNALVELEFLFPFGD